MNAKTYQWSKYKVTVAENGAVKVQARDILSGYSMAIEGNPWTVYDYGRFDSRGNLNRVLNIDFIRHGETIYHIPTYCDWYLRTHPVRPQLPPPGPSVSDAEKRRRAKEIVERSQLDSDLKETLKEVIETVENILEMIVMLTELLEFLESIPGLNVLMALVTWGLGLFFASREGIYQCRTLARFYAMAAWAWAKTPPQLPSKWLTLNKESNYSEAAFRDAWREQVAETWRELPAKIQGVNQAKIQKALKLIGGSQKGTLRFLMRRGLVEIRKKSGEDSHYRGLNALLQTYARDDD